MFRNRPVGGLRVKEIVSNDGVSTTNLTTTYDYNTNGVSNGVLMLQPQYLSTIDVSEYAYNSSNPNLLLARLYLRTISSMTIVPLSDFNGYHVYYSKVTESKNGGGQTVSEFFIEQPDGMDAIVYRTYPLLPAPPTVKTGMLKSSTQFNTANQQVSSTLNEMDVTYPLSVGNPIRMVKQGAGSVVLHRFLGYSLLQPTFVRLRKATALKDGVTVITENEYGLNGISSPTTTTTTNSDNKVSQLQYKYPHDFRGQPVYDAMISFNLITPIEIYRKVNGTIVEGSKTELSTTIAPTIQKPMPWKSFFWNRNATPNWQQTGEIIGYWPNGALKTFRSTGALTDIEYTWNKGVLTQKKFGTLVSNFQYINNNSQLLECITDENGLKTKFYYDGLQRLKKTENRMQDNGIDVQATMEYNYQYKNASNSFNFVRTKTTFANVTNPLITDSYSDGLGRPIGSMKQYYTPDNLHLKNVVTYDALGRQDKVYQPFESGYLGYQNAVNGMPADQIAYESSPLSRPIRHTNADNTTILTSYGTNIANEVRLFGGNDGSSVFNNGFYAANTLYKTTITDENGKQTVAFNDKLGRVILTRKFLNGENVDTYNVYDVYGQLIAVLPPGSVDASGNIAVSSALTFQYSYDTKGRLMTKKIPGSAIQKFYYDARNLLVLTQDGNMSIANKYLATLYDELGRVLKTGFAFVNPTLGVDFTLTDAQITDKLTETEYYPNKSWVKHQGAKVLKPTGAVTATDFVWSYVERRNTVNYTGNPMWTGKQHLMSNQVAKRKIGDSDQDGVDWSLTSLNGAQQPITTARYLFGGAEVSQVRTQQRFGYDNGNRLTNQKYLYTLNGAALSEPTFTLANMVYNAKDQLIEKNIGYRGAMNALQSIDYQYNVRGWLTHINTVSLYGGGSGGQQILTPGSFGTGTISGLAIAPYIGDALAQGFQQSETAESQALLAPPMMDNNADLFSQAITYGNPDSRTRATAQYNGNISSTTWQVAGRAKQSYGFTYDDLNRLTEATYFDITDNGTVNSTFSADNKFKEKLTYDLRGNITTLQRNGLNGGSWTSNGYTAGTYGLIDNLAYTYGIGNQLTQVTDYSLWDKGFKYKSTRTTGSDTDYRYDANGNLTYDRHKNISAIEYNYLNLPLVIRITHPTVPSASGSIEFVYDALGTKLRKIVKNNTGGVLNTYDYGNGVEYKDRVLQRIAHSEGAVVRNDFGLYQQEYVLRDHLGNTRVTFRDGVNRVTDSGGRQLPADPGYDDGIVTKDDIVQINHFYPFGLNMEGDWNGAQGKNKYQYNGKEWNDDFGLGWNHHDWRFYDVAIGRFVTIDPECETEEQESWNPYHFGYDDPIRYNDPDGRFPIETIWDIANVIYDAGKAVYHSIEGDWSKARSASADLAADVAATLIPYVPAGASKLIKGADGALDASRTVTNLEKRAKIIQEAQVNEKARNLSTTAVAKAKDANGQTHTLVASSRERLTPAQRKVLKKNEIEVKGKGHAETTIVNHADKNNLKVTQIAASRPVCKSCQTVLEAKKIKIKSPLKEK